MKNDSWVPPLICYSYISIHHKQWKLRNVNLKKKTIEGGGSRLKQQTRCVEASGA